MVTPESIQQGIAAGLACEHVEVAGDGQHFQALIVSAQFAGRNRVQRHQLVYGALGERMPVIVAPEDYARLFTQPRF